MEQEKKEILMANKERYQNPVIGDTISLRLFSYNSNNLADFDSIESIDIYHLDPSMVDAENPDGRRLVESFSSSAVVSSETGKYLLTITAEEEKYTIGRYLDIWTVKGRANQPSQTTEQCFDIYPDLWYATPIPIVYDFNFHFRPNKLRKGSKQYIMVEIVPNVPTAGDLRKYYENLAIVSNVKISIEQHCGDCIPNEQDLRLIVDEADIDYREKRYGYYQLDTEDMDLGIYSIWFKLEMGENIYISEKQKFQIYE